MPKTAYRLLLNKYDPDYIQAGYTPEEAKAIIDYGYDIDEDFKSKKDYTMMAKIYATQITKVLNLSKPLNWKVAFDDVTEKGYESDYCYCPKCDTYFWFGEECDCE